MNNKYDFDKIIDRHNTGSLKYDCAKERGMPDGLIPLWVADMDFAVPDEVVEALKKTAEHGIFGYAEPFREYFDILKKWQKKRFGWAPESDWIVQTPGIVFALAVCIKAFSNENDAVLIQKPVYYPFHGTILANNRRLINNALVFDGKKYGIDFDDFEKKITENNVKIFLLCSPHNPVGRVWTSAELTKIGDICLKHNVIIVSDEIHENFVYEGCHHTFLSLDSRYSSNTVVCTSPGKTFNLAGLQLSDIFIPNGALREKFKAEVYRCGYSQLNNFAHSGAFAAYKYGEDWFNQLLEYLKGNRDYLISKISSDIPQIKPVKPEGTCLLWLNLKDLRLSPTEQNDLVVNKAGLWLDRGSIFGDEGEGFERINFACPRKILEKAVSQLKNAVNKI
jgi:cystathionine beta-lyase